MLPRDTGSLNTRRGAFRDSVCAADQERTFGLIACGQTDSPLKTWGVRAAIPLTVSPQKKEAQNKAAVDTQGVRGQWHPHTKRSTAQQEAGARLFNVAKTLLQLVWL